MKVMLSPEQMEFVQSKIAAGEYQTPEQVVAVALGLLQTVQSEEVFDRVAELQERIRIGTEQIQQGRVMDGEEVFNRLQQRLTQEFGLAE
jgi:antitoxin ParD1/3/4